MDKLPVNNSVKKPQVILRIEDNNGIHLVKRWHDGAVTIEGHTAERSVNHNINVPAYLFSVDHAWAVELFKEAGKEYRL